MADVVLHAETRSEFGKGAARRIRRENKVPGVVYEHGLEPLHVSLPGHELLLALRTPNVLIELVVDGEGSQLAIPKAVQRDPLKGFLEHVDLLMVKRGERVTVEIPVVAEGELAPGGNLLEHVLSSVSVEIEATNIPDTLTVSVQGLDAGAAILAKDLDLPKGSVLVTEEDATVLQVLSPQAEELPGDEDEADEA
ncbi:50S ribosomal protein L25/general stress protein Ctc [Streptomyces sp. NPDC012461]|jgi:large subunit ribosomal protein L25|uniref:Large ribosomal subunit protein bL25 n=2 Tax=unclassified Streptomyces TaxID=2593676 RepID=A0A6G3QQX9_9ACTN|nr:MULTISPECIES: 50S ribosomal protein L25/general stress protein Ctc [unclassified Streptomyces]MBM7091667.1 50S ribosomal protein L25/general stress protein Ctc [Streptomyces sp. S12]NEA85634.1 50S ribosomal protein L25/general stress protein Ctc [Streptomyces sp. SID14436]NEC30638.1 50S ribosomal protein L25/general stress protein Ctc [Streptomyces sp. SID8111]NEC80327.1 50S ribosomal protein L25/general stress protein Ctc [Streptomyces sp. SID7958]